MSGLRVAVAGGGLGGLCLAQGLLEAGVDVTVYERDAQLAARRQARTASGCISPTDGRPRRTCWSARTVGSAVRRQYLPAAAPADTGKRVVYGKTPLGPAEEDRLPSALRDGFTAVIGGAVGMATGLVRFRERPEQAAPWLSPAGDYLMWAVAGDRGRFGVTDERLAAMSPAELHALTARLIMTWHPAAAT